MNLSLLFDKTKRDKIDNCLDNLYKKYQGYEHIINKEFNQLLFDNIPQDIIKQIALNLSLEDLDNLCETSATFHTLCEGSDSYNSYFWKQIIEKENDPFILKNSINNFFYNITEALIKSGQVDINFGSEDYSDPDLDIEYPLTIAVKNGNIKIIKLLLEHKADVNEENFIHEDYDFETDTPLTLAVKDNNLDIVKLLLKYNADINGVTSDNKNPLSIAINNQDDLMLNFLLENDVKIKLYNIYNREQSLLFISRLMKNIDDQKLLKKYKDIYDFIFSGKYLQI